MLFYGVIFSFSFFISLPVEQSCDTGGKIVCIEIWEGGGSLMCLWNYFIPVRATCHLLGSFSFEGRGF